MDAANGLWFVAVVIGPILLAAAFLWGRHRAGKLTSTENRRREEGTREVFDKRP
mgnify:FL=1